MMSQAVNRRTVSCQAPAVPAARPASSMATIHWFKVVRFIGPAWRSVHHVR